MALTDAGRRLTEEHRLAQITIGAGAAIISASLWSMLDPYDLDRSRGGWLEASLRATRMQFEQSSSVAEAYVTSYQAVEAPGGEGMITVPRFDPARIGRDLDLAGPQYIKSLIGQGLDPESAHAYAVSRMQGLSQKHAMSGGRGLIDNASDQDKRSVGYRRVTGPDPCTFCSMLASRGAHFGSQRAHSVYSSQDTALVRSSDGEKYHLYCQCTAEIVYGHWEPTEQEQRYVDAYDRAARAVDAQGIPRTQESILSLMRRDEEAGFRDSTTRRRNSPDTE